MLPLAYEACRGTLSPAVYNAANEIAVGAFLEGKIPFLEISRIVGYVLMMNKGLFAEEEKDFTELAPILEADRKARELAFEYIGNSSENRRNNACC
jgi:1-deoxy-D-xylulose-5-phosphate reductoisomerase